jgi:hypothetical protein
MVIPPSHVGSTIYPGLEALYDAPDARSAFTHAVVADFVLLSFAAGVFAVSVVKFPVDGDEEPTGVLLSAEATREVKLPDDGEFAPIGVLSILFADKEVNLPVDGEDGPTGVLLIALAFREVKLPDDGELAPMGVLSMLFADKEVNRPVDGEDGPTGVLFNAVAIKDVKLPVEGDDAPMGVPLIPVDDVDGAVALRLRSVPTINEIVLTEFATGDGCIPPITSEGHDTVELPDVPCAKTKVII